MLAGGEVLGVLPQREAGALEVARELGLAAAARLVPDLATDLIKRVGGELDHVERIDAALGVGAALGDRRSDPGSHVAGHQLDLFAALFTELIEEALDGRAVAAGGRPHQPAGVVADDDGQIALAPAVRYLVNGAFILHLLQRVVGFGSGFEGSR